MSDARPQKSRHKGRPRTQQSQQRLKIVVRHLPPNLPESVLHSSISAWEKSYDWIHYVPGKVASSRSKSDRFSRGYLKFRKQDDLQDFQRRFNGHLFVNAEGTEYRALVELSPYQKVPRSQVPSSKSNQDKSGTLTADPEYLAFVDSLTAPVVPLSSEAHQETKITPLIEYLRAQKVKNDAKAKLKKAKNAATKAKQQEEKKKAAQDLADASTVKAQAERSKKAATTKPAKAKIDVVNNTSVSKQNEARTKVVGSAKPSKRGKNGSAQEGNKSANTVKQPNPRPAKQETSKAAPGVTAKGSRSGNQGANTPAVVNPGRTNVAAEEKSSKPATKKLKKKDGKNTGPSKAKTSKEARIDISGPTPAEMVATTKGST